MRFLGTDLTRNIERDMFDYMPKEYEDYRESRAIVETEAAEFESLNGQIAEVLAQFFIDTATWGLANWERLVGVPTDPTKPLSQRRSVLKSKLRGIGTVTAALIKNVAESYSNGEVDVTEYGKNLLPAFSAWSKHANATVTGDYSLELNASASTQYTSYVVNVKPNTTYTISTNKTGADSRVQVRTTDRSTVLANLIAEGLATETFNTGNNTQLQIEMSNVAAGTFTFSNPQLEVGTVATKFEPRYEYTIGVRFVGKLGVPENLADIEKAIRDIIPAHLAVNFGFTYVLYNDVKTTYTDYNALATSGLTYEELLTTR